jgi:N-acyl-D-amino-acid deacylase
MITRRVFVGRTAAAAALLAWRSSEPAASVVVRGGIVYDGTGAPPIRADVAVDGDRITAVERDLSGIDGGVIDARGLAVAPGFIDVHSHSDLGLLVEPKAHSKIRQGVTTEIIGQDGSSLGPWRDGPPRDDDRPPDVTAFFRRLSSRGSAVNVSSMIGAGTVRGVVVGDGDRPASPGELDRMVALVRDAVRHGACGLSSGLEYVPGGFADLKELVALAGALTGSGLPYASHIRNEDDQLLAAVEEALAVGLGAGVPVHVSHLKAQGQRNWWKAEPVLGAMEAAKAGGLDATFDRYPYVAYSTGLGSLFPLWSRDGGKDAFLGRLADPALAPRIEMAVRDKIAKLGSWDAVQITSTGSEELAWTRGKRLGALAAARGVDPFVLLRRIIVEDENRSGMVGFGMSEDNTARILAHPLGMICSDGSALATSGPLGTGSPHPRSFGTFPRVLGFYCREKKVMSLEAAVHKMCGMPASRVRLPGRGRIRAGAFADLVVFDPDTVADRATFERPLAYPVGIRHVMVNGIVVIRDEKHTGALPGRVVTPAATP